MLDVAPNPLRSTGRIVLDLRRQMSLRITLYDLQGRQVAAFPATDLEAGRYSLPIDASRLTPGVYLLTARAVDGAGAVRRIVAER